MAVPNIFTNGTVADATLINANFAWAGTKPIGSIATWYKYITGVPTLDDTYVECAGQTLSDAGSLLNGQVIPNLNTYLAQNIAYYYKLDEPSGTTVTDSIAASNGTNSGASVNVTGKIGKCYRFDSTNDYLDLGTKTVFTGAFTFNAWVYMNSSLNTTNVLLSAVNGSVDLYINYRTYSNGTNQTRPGFEIGTGSVFHATDLGVGSWYMITCTWDGTTNANGMKLYINGTYSNAGTASGTCDGTQLKVGYNSAVGNQNSDFNLDEMSMWTRVLSAAEIALLYNSGSATTYNTSTSGFPNNSLSVMRVK